jgi:hypothetical protein
MVNIKSLSPQAFWLEFQIAKILKKFGKKWLLLQKKTFHLDIWLVPSSEEFWPSWLSLLLFSSSREIGNWAKGIGVYLVKNYGNYNFSDLFFFSGTFFYKMSQLFKEAVMRPRSVNGFFLLNPIIKN